MASDGTVAVRPPLSRPFIMTADTLDNLVFK